MLPTGTGCGSLRSSQFGPVNITDGTAQKGDLELLELFVVYRR